MRSEVSADRGTGSAEFTPPWLEEDASPVNCCQFVKCFQRIHALTIAADIWRDKFAGACWPSTKSLPYFASRAGGIKNTAATDLQQVANSAAAFANRHAGHNQIAPRASCIRRLSTANYYLFHLNHRLLLYIAAPAPPQPQSQFYCTSPAFFVHH